ncbi:hypothetical protein SAMN02745225_01014 [Ferrithrix thermotolerans DSM 19514]|uniref:Uncharacterized protein n=1 Tax=Ferrithrix thermotolerans DSM 19514 TaxID=1121881 RepID=A0A1M4ULE5_9ACTN|nr:hypothetical protein SAMN02745225_01014 [Ferrithrix thermotolerans DSM 19514]
MVSQISRLACDLQLSLVIVNDVDLITTVGELSTGASPMLFELMNLIDGVDLEATLPSF